MNFGKKLSRTLDLYRKPDGSQWTPREIEVATDGFVNVRYLTALKTDRIQQPSWDRLIAISDVVGAPRELWMKDLESWTEALNRDQMRKSATAFANRLNLLFELITRRDTGEKFTSAEVARRSGGRITEEEIEAARQGQLGDLTGEQYAALSEVFSVPPDYFYSAAESTEIDQTTLQNLLNRKNHLILNKLSASSEREKDVILNLIEQLEFLRDE